MLSKLHVVQVRLTQEKAAPNCQDMKKPSTAVPAYSAVVLVAARATRKAAAAVQASSETRIRFRGRSTEESGAELIYK